MDSLLIGIGIVMGVVLMIYLLGLIPNLWEINKDYTFSTIMFSGIFIVIIIAATSIALWGLWNLGELFKLFFEL